MGLVVGRGHQTADTRSHALRRSQCARKVTFRKDRKKIKATFGGHLPLGKCVASQEGKFAVVVDVREAVYKMFLAAFVQNKHEQARNTDETSDFPKPFRCGGTAASIKLR